MKNPIPRISYRSAGAVRPRAKYVSVASLSAFLLIGAGALSGCAAPAPVSTETATPDNLGPAAELVPDELKEVPISVVVLEDYPPIGYREGGELTGWAPDMVEAIAADTGLNIEIETSGFDAMLPGLQSDRWAFAVPPFTVTEERTEVVDFVSVGESYSVFIGLAAADLTVEQDSDVCGYTVAALSGGIEEQQLGELSATCEQEGKPPITVSTFASADQSVLALASSRVDLTLTSNGQLEAILEQGEGKFEDYPLEFGASLSGIGFPKGSAYGPIVLQAIKDLIADGTFDEITAKYDLPTNFSETELIQ